MCKQKYVWEEEKYPQKFEDSKRIGDREMVENAIHNLYEELKKPKELGIKYEPKVLVRNAKIKEMEKAIQLLSEEMEQQISKNSMCQK